MRYLLILLCLMLCGCASINATYDTDGRVTKIESIGFPPPSGKIGTAEISPKIWPENMVNLSALKQ